MMQTGTAPDARKTGAAVFGGATPILCVRSLQASIEYYVKVLGLKLNWQDPGIMAGISRERCHIMLCEGDQGHPGAWVWIGVTEIEPLFAEYKSNGGQDLASADELSLGI